MKFSKIKIDMELIIIITAGLFSMAVAIYAKVNGDRKERKYNKSQEAVFNLQKELVLKSDEITKLQKKSLNYFTGGENLPDLFPNLMGGDKISFSINNNGEYPMHDIFAQVQDPFENEKIIAEIRRGKELGLEVFHQLNKTIQIEELGINKLNFFYTTQMPKDKKVGTFFIRITSRNGIISKQITFARNEQSGRIEVKDIKQIEKEVY